jgi:hypothetical protein
MGSNATNQLKFVRRLNEKIASYPAPFFLASSSYGTDELKK